MIKKETLDRLLETTGETRSRSDFTENEKAAWDRVCSMCEQAALECVFSERDALAEVAYSTLCEKASAKEGCDASCLCSRKGNDYCDNVLSKVAKRLDDRADEEIARYASLASAPEEKSKRTASKSSRKSAKANPSSLVEA